LKIDKGQRIIRRLGRLQHGADDTTVSAAPAPRPARDRSDDFTLAMLGLLVLRLGDLQLLRGDEFFEKSQRVIRRVVALNAPRGDALRAQLYQPRQSNIHRFKFIGRFAERDTVAFSP
jgi:hypothetical protein